MTVLGCQHKPPCPTVCSMWQCAQRTRVEAALLQGIFTREEAARFLGKYGLPLSPASKVYQGQPVAQRKLL